MSVGKPGNWATADMESNPFGAVAPLPEIPELDRSLTELQQLEIYLQKKVPLQRLVHVKRIAESSRRAGFDETIRIVVPLIDLKGQLASDAEFTIRQAFAEELPGIVDFLMGRSSEIPDGESISPFEEPTLSDQPNYSILSNNVIPVLTQLLTDSSMEVRAAATKSLCRAAKHLTTSDLERDVLCMTLCLAHGEQEDHRATAVGLLHDLSPLLGTNLCTNFVSHELASLAEDPCFRVRKATAYSFANVCKAVGAEYATARLLPAYLKLARDSIWGVRQAVVLRLVSVCKQLTLATRINVFIPLIEQLTKDVSRWVRNNAYEILGQFMATLDTDSISPSFLKMFAQIPKLSSAIIDAEVSYFCAFNFPAILLTVQPDRWPELTDAYKSLCRNAKFNVRRSLSYSLHEIVKIFKSKLQSIESIEKDIISNFLPAFDIFFHDIEDVKAGVVEHFAEYLEGLPNFQVRKPYLDLMWELQIEADSRWRFRKMLCQQLTHFYKLFPLEIVADSLVRLTLALLRDRIAAVRQIAALAVGQLLKRLMEPELNEFTNNIMAADAIKNSFDDFVQQLIKFSTGKNYAERQLYIRICSVALINGIDYQMFSKYLLPHFLVLVKDRVVNVRLTLARAISETILLNKNFCADPLCLSAIDILRGDSDSEVSFYFSVKVDDCIEMSDIDVGSEPSSVIPSASEIYVEAKLHHNADIILHESESLSIEPAFPNDFSGSVEILAQTRTPLPDLLATLDVPVSTEQEENLVLHPKESQMIISDSPNKIRVVPMLDEEFD